MWSGRKMLGCNWQINESFEMLISGIIDYTMLFFRMILQIDRLLSKPLETNLDLLQVIIMLVTDVPLLLKLDMTFPLA
jgi:hypothetical protein